MRIEFEVIDIRGKKAIGVLKIFNRFGLKLFEHSAISGSSKNYYHLPYGNYTAKWINIRETKNGAYNAFQSHNKGPGWFCYIKATKDNKKGSKRSELGIHPCRLGTRGCIGVLFGRDDATAKRCFELLHNALAKEKEVAIKVFMSKKLFDSRRGL